MGELEGLNYNFHLKAQMHNIKLGELRIASHYLIQGCVMNHEGKLYY